MWQKLHSMIYKIHKNSADNPCMLDIQGEFVWPIFCNRFTEIFCSLKILDSQGKMRLYYRTILVMYRMFIENVKKNLTKATPLFKIYAKEICSLRRGS